MSAATTGRRFSPFPKCPFEDVAYKLEASLAADTDNEKEPQCPFHQLKHRQDGPAKPKDQRPVSLKVVEGAFRGNKDTWKLLKEVGGGDRIRQMCTRFYARAFEDETLDRFMFHGDGAANHGQRLADWIIEKMGGEGRPWTDSGRNGLRQVSHSMAWHSPKRPIAERGTRFKLDDCRIWMRLMFLSGRETGLDKHAAFWRWYVSFIQHFIAVYEARAPPFAVEDANWSKDKANVDKYVADGKRMVDVIGMGRI